MALMFAPVKAYRGHCARQEAGIRFLPVKIGLNTTLFGLLCFLYIYTAHFKLPNYDWPYL